MTPVSLAEFARIKGVSLEAVRKAIKAGRLVNCLVHGQGKKPKIDPAIGIKEWEKNTDHTKRYTGNDVRPMADRPPPMIKPDGPSAPDGAGGTYSSARSVRENYKARLAKLDYEERTGKLVNAEEVVAEAFKIARTVRDNILNIPDRISSELAGLTDAARIHQRLTGELKLALEALARDE